MTPQESLADEPRVKSYRWRFQFGLRTLLILVTLAGIVTAAVSWDIRDRNAWLISEISRRSEPRKSSTTRNGWPGRSTKFVGRTTFQFPTFRPFCRPFRGENLNHASVRKNRFVRKLAFRTTL